MGTWIVPMIDDGTLTAYYFVPPERWPLELMERQATVVELRRHFSDLAKPGSRLKPPRVPKGFAFDMAHDDGLPSRQALAGRPVIVTFDLDYFSCRWASEEGQRVWVPASTSEEIRAAVASCVGNLKSRGIRPAAILVADSPGFVPRAQAPFITETLLGALRQAGFAR